MKKLTILGVVVCVMMLLVPVAVLSAPAGPPSGLDVKIIEQPVQVTGDVNATVSGDVNVANTPNVKVVNDATSPVPVTEVGAASCNRDYQRYRGQHSGSTDTFVSETVIGEIPDGMAYVIESASMLISSTPSVSVITCDIAEGVGEGPVVLHPVAYLTPQLIASVATANVRVASTEGRIVIMGSEQKLMISVQSAFFVDYVINGYWVDATCAQP